VFCDWMREDVDFEDSAEFCVITEDIPEPHVAYEDFFYIRKDCCEQA
jgi:hypothetical protein